MGWFSRAVSSVKSYFSRPSSPAPSSSPSSSGGTTTTTTSSTPSTSSGSSSGGGSSTTDSRYVPAGQENTLSIIKRTPNLQQVPVGTAGAITTTQAQANEIGRRNTGSGGSQQLVYGSQVASTPYDKPTTEKLTGARVTEETKRLAPKSYKSEKPNFDEDYNNMNSKEKLSEIKARYNDKGFGDRYKDAVGDKWYSNFKVISGITGGLAPFQLYSTKREGDIKVNDPMFIAGSTGVLNTKTGTYNQPKKTKFDIETEKNIYNYDIENIKTIQTETAKDVSETGIRTQYETQATERQSYYQGQVNEGELSIKDAETSLGIELGVINTKYQADFGSKFDKIATPRIDRYNQRAGSNAIANQYQFNVPKGIVTAGLVAGTGIGIAGSVAGSVGGMIVGSGTNTLIASQGFGTTAEGLNLIPFGFKFPRIGGGAGNPKTGKVKTKAKYSYTPDYRSLVLGTRGKETKGSYGGKFSGFEARPITNKWSKMLGIGGGAYKMPKVIRVIKKKKKKKKKRRF